MIKKVVTLEERRKCEKGHLICKQHKTFCQACWNKTPKGRANQHRSDALPKRRARVHRWATSPEGRAYHAKYAYKRLSLTGSWAIAMGRIVLGNNVLTQQRMDAHRVRTKIGLRRYRERWGQPAQNPLHRYRWEMIREGQWTEADHPLER